MNIPTETQKEVEEAKNRKLGTTIVVLGALASVTLWLIVLINGEPVKPFTTFVESFAYALGVTFPVIVLSVFAILKLHREK
jgi:MoxR-like ATPase